MMRMNQQSGSMTLADAILVIKAIQLKNSNRRTVRSCASGSILWSWAWLAPTQWKYHASLLIAEHFSGQRDTNRAGERKRRPKKDGDSRTPRHATRETRVNKKLQSEELVIKWVASCILPLEAHEDARCGFGGCRMSPHPWPSNPPICYLLSTSEQFGVSHVADKVPRSCILKGQRNTKVFNTYISEYQCSFCASYYVLWIFESKYFK